MYLRAKFEVSNIILTSFRQGGEVILLPSTSKRIPKKPTQIRVIMISKIISDLENVCLQDKTSKEEPQLLQVNFSVITEIF